MKLRLVIAAAVAAGAYLGMHFATSGAADPAMLAWCASGIFGLALGFATLNLIRTASLSPLAPRPLASPIRSDRPEAPDSSAEPGSALLEPQTQAV